MVKVNSVRRKFQRVAAKNGEKKRWETLAATIPISVSFASRDHEPIVGACTAER